MNVLTGGSSHTSGGSSYSAVSGGGSSYSATGSGGSSSYVGGRGGGTPYGISGGSAVYTNGRVIGVSGTGSGKNTKKIWYFFLTYWCLLSSWNSFKIPSLSVGDILLKFDIT